VLPLADAAGVVTDAPADDPTIERLRADGVEIVAA
jgi:hypothetical protein